MKNELNQWVRVGARGLSLTAVLATALLIQLPAYSATPANTLVTNRATASFVIEGEEQTEYSNIESFRVDELIDLTVVTNNATGVATLSPATGVALSFTLTNTGNGSEAYALTFSQSATDQFDADNVKIYLDTNDNDLFDPLSDALYVSGTNDPDLAQGASTHVFIVSDIPASRPNEDKAGLTLTATSLTGTGAPGTSFAGAGTGGVWAVLGLKGGQDSDDSYYTVTTATGAIVKSQSILDPLGGNKAVQNAIITYTLDLGVTGTGTLTSVKIVDAIPTGTTYEAGSIKLDGTPLTDSADLDAGVFNGTGIEVQLGAVPAPTTHTVTFRVKIQ